MRLPSPEKAAPALIGGFFLVLVAIALLPLSFTVWYVAGMTAFCAGLTLMYCTRWFDGANEEHIWTMGIAWPMTLAVLPFLVREEEDQRRTRLVREVMES
jgi:hypothetical protein